MMNDEVEAISTNTSKQTEPPRKKIRYEQELRVGTSNQSSGPVHKKRSKSVKTIKQCSEKQKRTPRAASELLEERGGLSLQQQHLQYTSALETAAVQSDDTDDVEPTAHLQLVDTSVAASLPSTEWVAASVLSPFCLNFDSVFVDDAPQESCPERSVKMTDEGAKARGRGRGRGRGRARGHGCGRARARGEGVEGSPHDTTSLDRQLVDASVAASLPSTEWVAASVLSPFCLNFDSVFVDDAPQESCPERSVKNADEGVKARERGCGSVLARGERAKGSPHDTTSLDRQLVDASVAASLPSTASLAAFVPSTASVLSTEWVAASVLTPFCLYAPQESCPESVHAIPELDHNGTAHNIGQPSQEQQMQEWLDHIDAGDEDSEDEDPETTAIVAAVATKPVNEAPAYLPEDLGNRLTHFLTEDDKKADKLVRGLLNANELTFNWTSDPDSFLGRREDFVGPSGPTFTLEDSDRPIDIFLKFFDDELFDVLVKETNQNCAKLALRQSLQKNKTGRLHTKLRETDRSEMGIFLAVLVLQGMFPLPVEGDYFRQNGLCTFNLSQKLISHNRFLLMKKILHFTDDDASDSTNDNNKLRKLAPVLNLLSSKFKALYLPSRYISIDESLLKWQGRLNFAQKIATRAAKAGVHSYELCESKSGYCWNFTIHTGKGAHQCTDGQTDGRQEDAQETARPQLDRQGDRQKNASVQIVLDLVQPLLHRGHTLVMDNFNNSPLLARYLKLNGTDCFGTLRVSRKFVPEAIKNTPKWKLRPGELIVSYCRDMTVTLWHDTNLVALISTYHGGELGWKEKHGYYKCKPQVVLDYNLSMGGVDKKDQLLSSQPIERTRNQAWYKKVFGRLLNVTVLNAYIIYKTKHPKITQRQFRTTLVNELISKFKGLDVVKEPAQPVVTKTLAIKKGKRERPILKNNHFVGQGLAKHSRCTWCKKCRTIYICKQCDVSLCLDNCFEQYHTVT